MHTYQYRLALNLEYLQVRDSFLGPIKIICTFFATDQETYKIASQDFSNFSAKISDTVEE